MVKHHHCHTHLHIRDCKLQHYHFVGHFTYPSLHKVLLYSTVPPYINTRAVVTGAGVVSVAALKRGHSCVSAVCCHNYLSSGQHRLNFKLSPLLH